MNLRSKVDGQPAYVLHTNPFRETSLIVEVFSRDFGRVALLARGARLPPGYLGGAARGRTAGQPHPHVVGCRTR